jgi:hypothetical protein
LVFGWHDASFAVLPIRYGLCAVWARLLGTDIRDRVSVTRSFAMKQVTKPATDDDLIQQFLNKGGKVTKGKTKPPKPELGLSNNSWNNPYTKEEKAAMKKP